MVCVYVNCEASSPAWDSLGSFLYHILQIQEGFSSASIDVVMLVHAAPRCTLTVEGSQYLTVAAGRAA